MGSDERRLRGAERGAAAEPVGVPALAAREVAVSALATVYALSGTAPGFGASNSRIGNAITQVPLTTSASNSLAA